jgi:DNA-binding MarR family transcriptional regulator
VHNKIIVYLTPILNRYSDCTQLQMKDKTIDYILRATWQAVSRMYNEEASKFDGSMAIGFALLSIDKEEGTPSTAISSRMGMEATSLTRTLKTLEEKGLITRQKNPEDGRGVLIYLTDLGKEMRRQSKETVLQFNETIKKNISEEKLNHFMEVAEVINDLITEKKYFRK